MRINNQNEANKLLSETKAKLSDEIKKLETEAKANQDRIAQLT